jgi:hypothetical protein
MIRRVGIVEVEPLREAVAYRNAARFSGLNGNGCHQQVVCVSRKGRDDARAASERVAVVEVGRCAVRTARREGGRIEAAVLEDLEAELGPGAARERHGLV